MNITKRMLRIEKDVELVPCVVDDNGMDVHMIGCSSQLEAVAMANLIWDHMTPAERESRNKFYAGYLFRGEDGEPDLGYGAYIMCDFKEDPDDITLFTYAVEVK